MQGELTHLHFPGKQPMSYVCGLINKRLAMVCSSVRRIPDGNPKTTGSFNKTTIKDLDCGDIEGNRIIGEPVILECKRKSFLQTGK
jgi:hypothetical protein